MNTDQITSYCWTTENNYMSVEHSYPEVSGQFSSVQDGIYVLGKAHICSSLSLRSFPNVAFETSIVHLINDGPLILSRKII